MRKPDGYDLLAIIGLGLVGWGVGMWSVPAALVVIGLALLAFGLFGATMKGGQNGKS